MSGLLAAPYAELQEELAKDRKRKARKKRAKKTSESSASHDSGGDAEASKLSRVSARIHFASNEILIGEPLASYVIHDHLEAAIVRNEGLFGDEIVVTENLFAKVAIEIEWFPQETYVPSIRASRDSRSSQSHSCEPARPRKHPHD